MGDAVEVVFATVGAGAPEVGVGAGAAEREQLDRCSETRTKNTVKKRLIIFLTPRNAPVGFIARPRANNR